MPLLLSLGEKLRKVATCITKKDHLGIALVAPGLATYLWLLASALVLARPTLCDNMQLPEVHTAYECPLKQARCGWRRDCTHASVRVHLPQWKTVRRNKNILKVCTKSKLTLSAQIFLFVICFFLPWRSCSFELGIGSSPPADWSHRGTGDEVAEGADPTRP